MKSWTKNRRGGRDSSRFRPEAVRRLGWHQNSFPLAMLRTWPGMNPTAILTACGPLYIRTRLFVGGKNGSVDFAFCRLILDECFAFGAMAALPNARDPSNEGR